MEDREPVNTGGAGNLRVENTEKMGYERERERERERGGGGKERKIDR